MVFNIFAKPNFNGAAAMTSKTRVLFLCVANSARSQMAEALLRHTDPDGYEAFSAGTLPDEVDRRARMALDQLGVATDSLRSKSLDEFAGQHFVIGQHGALGLKFLPASGAHSKHHHGEKAG